MCCLWVPEATAQQVTRVGNLLTITRDNPALAAIPPEANGALDVAATRNTSFALMPNGTVVAWGSDEYGLVTDAKYVRGAKKIVAGLTHAVALLENGTLYSWGSNDQNLQATAVSIENAVDVVAAPGGTGVLKANGDAVVWGNLPGAPATFKSVKKLEMIPFYHPHWQQPIAVVYSTSGSVQIHASANNLGQLEVNKPSDLSQTASISCIYGQMIAIQADSSLKTWVIQGYGEWNKSQFDSINDVNRIGSSLFPVEPGGLDGHRMMPADDTRGDVWTVVGAWQSLACG